MIYKIYKLYTIMFVFVFVFSVLLVCMFFGHLSAGLFVWLFFWPFVQGSVCSIDFGVHDTQSVRPAGLLGRRRHCNNQIHMVVRGNNHGHAITSTPTNTANTQPKHHTKWLLRGGSRRKK